MSHQASLQRSLSLPLVIFFGMGNILGAGIYVLVGKVAGEAGLNAPLAFMLASIIAGITAFSYAELSARYPESAGEAVYLFKGFNKAWLATLIGGIIAVAGMVSAAAIAHGFAGYFQIFFDVPKEAIIVVLFIVLAAITIWGISQSVFIASVFTSLEIIGLLLILWVSKDLISLEDPRWSQIFTITDFGKMQGIFIGGFLAFYAYIGFEDMVNVAEEVKDPTKNMPRAILICLLLSGILYIAVAVTSVLVVPLPELINADAPLAKVYETATNKKPVFISIIALFAVVNGALIQIIMASRVIYGMANNGWIPQYFAQVNARTNTPIRATIMVACTIVIFALLFPIVTLAEFTSFLLLIVFSLVNLALIKIKHKSPQPEGITVYPIWIPYLGFITSFSFLVGQLFIS